MPTVAGADAPSHSTASNVIEGSYIVVYKDSVGAPGAATEKRESSVGFQADDVYRSALNGFAAELSDSQVAQLESDPAVDFIDENREVQATGWVPRTTGEPVSPPGIRRVKAATGVDVREASQVNVAVIDTGIRLNHFDLNALPGKDCVDPGTSPTDGNGHGTHVAGTIGAHNNGVGVTGIAPGTGTYAVRVLDDGGSGSFAGIICGIDWVTANRTTKNIGVANMSLGGLGQPVATCAATTDAMHKAICRSTNRNNGVDYVVAAGNDGWDFDFPSQPNVPAGYPQVLTVSAMADSDGRGGGLGPDTGCSGVVGDDDYAPFSNYALTDAGERHTIAAPGVCIKSTWLGPGAANYNTISGTSMASPHMAGMVALCMGEVGSAAGPCSTRTPAQVIQFMRAGAAAYNDAVPSYGFHGDPNDPITDPYGGTSDLAYYGFLGRTRPPLP